MNNDLDFLQAITGRNANSCIDHEPHVAIEVSVDEKRNKRIINKFNFSPMSVAEAQHHAEFGLDATKYHEDTEFEHEDKETEVMGKILKKSEELANKHTAASIKSEDKKPTPQSNVPTTHEAEADEEYDPYDALDKQ